MRTVLIDDEIACTSSLQIELNTYCPTIEIVALFNSPDDAILYLKANPPDLVFLDVDMGVMTGFDLLRHLKDISFEIIFVTAHENFALKAFEYRASDYLLKPILKHRLIESVERVSQKIQHKRAAEKGQISKNEGGEQRAKAQVQSIPIPTSDGLEMLKIMDIIVIEADGNYCHIQMEGGKKLVVTKSIKEFDQMLQSHNFVRTHNSYLVNINHVKKYVKGSGGYLVMSNGSTVDVSRTNKDKVLQYLIPN
ncbi:MAG: response regulator transcription factor [Saprospiraceae bacterium]|jgi:two-component system LytT family response regulator|nr:response regulator transcription factor [Saprospiraceae bacterium]